MTSYSRKLLLTVHVLASVGWFGALLVFLAHAAVSLVSRDQHVVRSACIAMGLTAWLVILPLSVASFVSGIVHALGTAWGLIRHYWVIAKLLLTAFATAVLLLKLAPISALSEAAAIGSFSASSLLELKTSLMLHAVGGLAVLFAITVLAVYKPAGVTPFRRGNGWTASGLDTSVAVRLPRWVRISLIVVASLVLLLALLMLQGSHGPSMHFVPG